MPCELETNLLAPSIEIFMRNWQISFIRNYTIGSMFHKFSIYVQCIFCKFFKFDLSKRLCFTNLLLLQQRYLLKIGKFLSFVIILQVQCFTNFLYTSSAFLASSYFFKFDLSKRLFFANWKQIYQLLQQRYLSKIGKFLLFVINYRFNRFSLCIQCIFWYNFIVALFACLSFHSPACDTRKLFLKQYVCDGIFEIFRKFHNGYVEENIIETKDKNTTNARHFSNF